MKDFKASDMRAYKVTGWFQFGRDTAREISRVQLANTPEEAFDDVAESIYASFRFIKDGDKQNIRVKLEVKEV